MPVVISKQALKRLPEYLQYLRNIEEKGIEYITATTVAEALRLNEIQVRKDLALVSSRPGKPMVGFRVCDLTRDLRRFLAYDENVREAVLVGAGALGRALLNYSGFSGYGMKIVAAFDANPALAGETFGQCEVYPMDELEHICRRLKIMIGIVTVPADAAQAVCDALVHCGIRAVWNFSPTFLRAPQEVIVQNEIMASSLAELKCSMRAGDAEDAR